MQGETMGVGGGFALQPLFRIVLDSSIWSMPNILYGSFPDCGTTYYLPRLDGEIGMYLALTGKRVQSYDILRIGLGTHCSSVEKMLRFEQDTCRVEKGNMDEIMNAFHPHTHVPLYKSAIEKHEDAIKRWFNKDSLYEIIEALEKEKSPWATRLLQRLMFECSPLMLHVTFRLQRMGRYLNNLDEALQLEYRVAQHMIKSHDFYEGISSRLIKRRPPRWQHNDIFSVPNKLISQFFEPAEDLELQPCHPTIRPSKILLEDMITN